MKRALGGGNGSATEYDPSNPPTNLSSKKAKKDKGDYPDNVYKPGEPMPRPKYRGPYNQAHQDKLSAFSFGDAWKKRKNSTGTDKSAKGGSEYSPMGIGLLKPQTVELRPPPPPPKDSYTERDGPGMQKSVTSRDIDGGQGGHSGLQSLDTQRTITNGQLFTADELANAMSQSTLKPSRREIITSD
ncbi:MAG: hypothetical protein Q9217_003622 [Psora testacea]